MLIGAVADIHGNFDALDRAMARHPDVPFWLCVGDVGEPRRRVSASPRRRSTGSRATTRTSTASTRGAPATEPCPNLHYIPNGTAVARSGR